MIAPSSGAVNAQVQQFKEQGIPAVYIDRDPGGAAIQAFVGTDNFKAGTRAGLIMADKLHGRGTVLLFRMQEEVASTRERERGFLEAARASGLRVIVGPYIGSDVGAARLKAANLLSSLAEPVNGVFTPNESVTLAMLSALRGEPGLLASHELVFLSASISMMNWREPSSVARSPPCSCSIRAHRLSGRHRRVPCGSKRSACTADPC